MKYQELLAESKTKLELNPFYQEGIISSRIFELGSKWMYGKLNEDAGVDHLQFNGSINYMAYGLFKYGSSLLVFVLSLLFFVKINLLLAPLAIIIFYLVEIHFIFLFPIVLDHVENPIWASIKQTYKTGVITALVTVIPIACFMLWGFLNGKDPLRNWYIGCLATIIWYKNEVRNRI